MPNHVKLTPELLRRIEVLEGQYKTAKAFAEALGVDAATVRHWKLGSRKFISRPIEILVERIEKEKLKSKQVHCPGCNCEK